MVAKTKRKGRRPVGVCIRIECNASSRPGELLCETHFRERYQGYLDAAAKATLTKRARYPKKYYAEPESIDFRWQQFAATSVARAVRHGLLPDLKAKEYACVDCGCRAQVYDHRDYGNPIDVVPVCLKCNSRRGIASFPPAERFEFDLVSHNQKGSSG